MNNRKIVDELLELISESNDSSNESSDTKASDKEISKDIAKDAKKIFPDKDTQTEPVNEYTSLVDTLFSSYFPESSDDDKVPDEMKPIVKTLESKGYQVKYASPGYDNTRFDNDRNKDGVINAKMVSTARIVFERNYNFKNTPQGWTWKVTGNNTKSLYAKEYTYNEKHGSKETAVTKWREYYMSNVKDWADNLPDAGDDSSETVPDENFK